MMGVLSLSMRTVRQALCAFADGLVVMGAFFAARWLRYDGDIEDVMFGEGALAKAIAAALVVTVCLYCNELYEDCVARRRIDLFLSLARSLAIGAVVLMLLSYSLPPLNIGRSVVTIQLPLAFAGLLAWRCAYQWAFGSSRLRENVIILGTGQSARQIAAELIRRTPLGFHVVGFLGEHRAEIGHRLLGAAVIGTVEDLEDVVRAHRVNLIVVALDDRRGRMPIDSLLRCRLDGVRIEEVTSFFEGLTGKILVSNLRPSWLVFSQGFNKPRLVQNVKRAWELLLALALLAIAAPVMALIALLVRLDSPGPVFYRQERVGKKGLRFLLAKFRTMRVGAENGTGPVWASEGGDPRATRVGRWLRRLRLDEMPQLWNVVRGEMSFVGPRPERPQFVEMLGTVVPYYDQRHTVPPGITGWAQIKFSYGATIEDSEQKLEYDLYYIKHMSVMFDVAIMLDTVKVMALGRGAR